MTIADIWGYLTGAKAKEAQATFNGAYNRLMTKLDKLEGEERAREALSSLGERMRGDVVHVHRNGLVADH